MRRKGTFMLRIRPDIVRMNVEKMVKRITERRPIAVRRFGRPRLRREDDVREDVGRMKIQNWNKLAMDGEARKEFLSRPKIIRNLGAKRRSSLRLQDRQL
jgi:hypothetical protein